MNNDNTEVNKGLVTACKLKPIVHPKQPYAVNSFAIGNRFGHIIGGNLMLYMFENEQGSLCYPTVFKSRRAIRNWLTYNCEKVAIIEKYCYDALIVNHEETV